MHNEVIIRWLGMHDYQACWDAMRTFTHRRDSNTPDEIWLLEHPHVFTQGQNSKPEHMLRPNHIPVIKVDRGGQITYHGPGQLVVYPLIDIQRKKFNVRQLVTLLENTVIELLKQYKIQGLVKREAPGVYVNQEKICSIGLRIRRGCSYHGLALNVAMDLEPFSQINPCGFSELKMTQLSELINHDNLPFLSCIKVKEIGLHLTEYLIKNLVYNKSHFSMENNNGT